MNTRTLREVQRAVLPSPDKIDREEEVRRFKNVSRTNVESGISSVGTAPPGSLSDTRVLSMEDAAVGFCGVMTSKDSSRSSSRSKLKVKEDIKQLRLRLRERRQNTYEKVCIQYKQQLSWVYLQYLPAAILRSPHPSATLSLP